jgi:hypothetical protein
MGRIEVMEPSSGPAPVEPTIHKAIAVLGLVLAGSAAMPWLPDGATFVDLVLEAFHRSVLEAVLRTVGFGSPVLFGLCVALGILVLRPPIARRLVRLPIGFMHSQLVLVAIVMMTERERVVGAVALLGFAVVSALRFAVHSARTRAEGDGPSLAWLVRWGAMIVAGVAGWMQLQRVADIAFGRGLDVALASAVLMILVFGRRRFRAAAPMR